jgi:hypothetical protein
VAGGAGIDGRVRDEVGTPMIYGERAMARHLWVRALHMKHGPSQRVE